MSDQNHWFVMLLFPEDGTPGDGLENDYLLLGNTTKFIQCKV